ncbi:MAG: CFI-box-CTERM domain-containing protein, partial [Dehalococcoidia bacterium]
EGGSVTEPGEGVFTYDEGTVVDLVATPDAGYRFDQWTGDVGTIADVYDATTTITMNGDYAVTANFVVIYAITVSSTEGGSVTTPGEGVFTYDEGTVVDLVATPDAGYRFVEWTGDVGTIADVYDATTTITMNGDYAITANFVRQYNLSTSSTAGGTVTTPGQGTFTYDDGTVVSLVATPTSGYRFVNWTGNVGTIADVYDATTTITMNGDYAITANFIIRQYTLTTSSTAGGTVTPPGVGTRTYDAGTVVSLVATPTSGYRFVNWTGSVGTIANVNAASTTITMNSNYSVTANFVAIYDLSISSTEGVSVIEPGEGVFTYDEGTVVHLVAEAEEGYRFDEWTGDVGTIADVYAATTTINMNGDYSITANFEQVPPSQVYPTVTTQAATNITTSSTTLNMSYTVGDFSPVEVRFAYKKSTDSAWSYTAWVSKTADGTHAEVLTGLDFNTTYHFKSRLKYNGAVVGGTTLQFTTDTPSPSGSGGCFIATAAYGTPTAKQIDLFREFRDAVLLKNTVGCQFVALYYQLSPPVADFIAGNALLTTLVRDLLVDPIVWVVQATGDIRRN